MKIEKTTLKDIDNLIKISKTESMPKKHNKWYVDNQRLHECFVKYNKLKTEALEKGEDIPFIADDYIGQCIMNISTGMAQNWRFRSYYTNWKTDMISDGIEAALKYSRAYDPYKKMYDKDGNEKKPNPHAYISMIVFNAFVQRIKKEKDEEYVQKQAFLMHDGFAANDLQAEEFMTVDMDGTNAFEFYQSYVSDVAEHEKKLEERKTRYIKPKEEKEEEQPIINEFFTFD